MPESGKKSLLYPFSPPRIGGGYKISWGVKFLGEGVKFSRQGNFCLPYFSNRLEYIAKF